MNTTVMCVLGTVILACFIIYLYGVFKGNSICNKLAGLLMEQKYDEFDRLADSKEAKRYAKPFNLEFLKLNAAIARKDDKQVGGLLELFDGRNASLQHKAAVYSRCFYYHIAQGNTGKAEELYKKMSEENILIPDRIRYVYDTYCEKGFSYIEEIEKAVVLMKEEEKTEYYALLADMYKNKGDQKKFDEYRILVIKKMQQ